jgi:hypothetical protein
MRAKGSNKGEMSNKVILLLTPAFLVLTFLFAATAWH